MRIESLLQHPKALPTIPKVVQQLIQSLSHENVSADEISQQIAADPVLSAKLLRLANSAHFHVSRSVGTVDEALMMLGFVQVRTLVLSSGLTHGFKGTPGMDLMQFWRYSLHTACAARWLAQQAHLNSDLAFTTGITHAIGQLVMHAGMPEAMLALDRQAGALDARRLDMERQSFGYTHADVGAEVARRWNFPEEIVHAVRHWHDAPEQSDPDPLSVVVHVAAWAARTDEQRLGPDDRRATVPTDMLHRLDLHDRDLLERMPALADLAAGLEDLVH